MLQVGYPPVNPGQTSLSASLQRDAPLAADGVQAVWQGMLRKERLIRLRPAALSQMLQGLP